MLKKIKLTDLYFLFSIGGVVLTGFLLRFINYPNRWGLAADQAQFWIVSKYALKTFQLPLLGPFSSGGPFQTGGEWYWLVMAGHFLLPSYIISPWIFMSFITLIAVGIMIVIGTVWESKKLGLILGILIATSPVQISQSSNLTNQTPIILFSSLSLLFMILFAKMRNNLLFFLHVLCIGVATSIHIQAVALIPFGIITGAFFVKNYIRGSLLFILGISIPWIPVLIADSKNHFFNTTNMLTYFSNPQSQVSYDVLGRRWLTFAGQFIPESWGQITGGMSSLGYLSLVLIAIVGGFLSFKRKISKELWVIYVSTAIMIVILRYTRTPLFDSFFIFLHPFVIFLTGYVIYHFMNSAKILGVILLILFVGGSLTRSVSMIRGSSNVTAIEIETYKKYLIHQFPKHTFSIYDYKYKYTGKSLPLVMTLYNDGLLDKNGIKIGIGVANEETSIQYIHPAIFGNPGAYQLFLLESSTSAELGNNEWAELNPAEIYRSVEYWYNKK